MFWAGKTTGVHPGGSIFRRIFFAEVKVRVKERGKGKGKVKVKVKGKGKVRQEGGSGRRGVV